MESARKALRVSEMADAIGIKKSLAYELVARGEIPSIRVSPRAIRIPVAALDAWINERAATAANGDGSQETVRVRLRSE